MIKFSGGKFVPETHYVFNTKKQLVYVSTIKVGEEAFSGREHQSLGVRLLHCEVWEDSELTVTVLPDDYPAETKKMILGSDAKLIRTIDGLSWEDVMTQHYQLMGWKPYVPMTERQFTK